jgi:NAD(P)-dependent dehydrogenase (short-subunit alcohol dehydrogenase family)
MTVQASASGARPACPDRDRVLLVTGGSRGIGAAIVRAAAADGYRIAFSYVRDAAAAAELAGELRAAGAQVVGVQGDVADPDFAPRFLQTAQAELGPATALVNNAGATGPLGRFTDADVGIVRRAVEVNLLGAMYMAREVAAAWLSAGRTGRIVNISSMAAAYGAPDEYVHYAAAKAGLEAFTVGLGRELAHHGIRVNAVAPGITDTDIHAAAGDAGRPERLTPRIPMRRVGEPEEIAAAALWLLSDEASYITATVLRAAGGL